MYDNNDVIFPCSQIEGVHVMVNWVSRTAGDKTMISTPVLKLLWALLQQKGDMNGNSELRYCHVY